MMCDNATPTAKSNVELKWEKILEFAPLICSIYYPIQKSEFSPKSLIGKEDVNAALGVAKKKVIKTFHSKSSVKHPASQRLYSVWSEDAFKIVQRKLGRYFSVLFKY